MKITPLDLQHYQFRKRQWNGLDPADVRGFLELVREEMEELLRENHALKDELKRTVQLLGEFREREQTVKDTLLTAQKVCDELRSSAAREAETIVAAAELKAQDIVQQAGQRATKLQSEIRELRRQKIAFEETLRGLLQSHMRLLGVDAERQGDMFEEKLAVVPKKEKG